MSLLRLLLAALAASLFVSAAGAQAASAASILQVLYGGVGPDAETIVRENGGATIPERGGQTLPASGFLSYTTTGAYGWSKGGRTLTFVNPSYDLGGARVTALVDGQGAPQEVLSLDTANAGFSFVRCSATFECRIEPYIGGITARLAPAGASALNAFFGTTAFRAGLELGLTEVTF